MPKAATRSGSSSIPHINLVQHGHRDSTGAIAQAEVVEEFMHEDALDLMQHFQGAYLKARANVRRPNVLMVGFSGAGKSSIINTVFGNELAREGAGKPITQHFQRYCPDDQNIVIYDSKGMEAGMHFEEFVESTHSFFDSLHMYAEEEPSNAEPTFKGKKKAASPSRDQVEHKLHLIWYVVNSAAARFQDFEERVCKELFPDVKIIFLLNKADISTEEQRNTMRELIEDMNLPNCIGIFETTSSKYSGLRTIDVCPVCGGSDLIIHRRTKSAVCEQCQHKEHLSSTTGLEEVVALTTATLPKIARESFIAAQKVSLMSKERRAKRVIRDFYDEQAHCFTQAQLLQSIAKMLTRLSILWDFRAHGHLYGTHIARDLVSTFSVRDKIFLFVHKNKHQKLRATAIGIIWNRCVRNLFKKVLTECLQETHEVVQEKWAAMMESAFEDLSDEGVDLLEDRIEAIGLQAVLQEEMPGGVAAEKKGKSGLMPKVKKSLTKEDVYNTDEANGFEEGLGPKGKRLKHKHSSSARVHSRGSKTSHGRRASDTDAKEKDAKEKHKEKKHKHKHREKGLGFRERGQSKKKLSTTDLMAD